MKKTNLTQKELDSLIELYLKKGIPVTKPLINLPLGAEYELTFITQGEGENIDIVSNMIDYEQKGNPKAFPQIICNVINKKDGKKYNYIGIAYSDEVRELVTDKTNLTKSFDAVVREGTKRNFLMLADVA
jgi:hypothetical protein